MNSNNHSHLFSFSLNDLTKPLVQRVFDENAQYQELAQVEDSGSVVATAVAAAVGNAQEFAKERRLVARVVEEAGIPTVVVSTGSASLRYASFTCQLFFFLLSYGTCTAEANDDVAGAWEERIAKRGSHVPRAPVTETASNETKRIPSDKNCRA